jgi:hypothetical protein
MPGPSEAMMLVLHSVADLDSCRRLINVLNPIADQIENTCASGALKSCGAT